MRISLKWIMVVVVYVAVAAAAFTQASWVYAEILCGISLFALVLSALLTIYARGRTRIASTGFLIAAVGFLAYCELTPAEIFMSRTLKAAGLTPSPSGLVLISEGPAPAASPPMGLMADGIVDPFAETMSDITVAAAAPYAPPADSGRLSVMLSSQPVPVGVWVSFDQFTKAANAMATLVFGLAGALLGVAVSSRCPSAAPS